MTDFQFKYGPSHRYWELALAKRADLWDGPDPLMHPNPQQGYWKARFGKDWEPVSIYRNKDGELVANRGKNRVIVPAEDAWPYCGANPISYEDYGFWWHEGKFPGEINVPAGIGHNSGDKGALIEQALHIKVLAMTALDEQVPLDQAKADELANYDTACLRRIQALEKARKADKHAIIETARRVDQEYLPTIEELRAVRGALKARLARFFLMHPGAKVGGQLGNRASAKKKRIAQIDDAAKFAAFLVEEEHPDLMACLEMIAKGLARTGEEAPGVSFSTEVTA